MRNAATTFSFLCIANIGEKQNGRRMENGEYFPLYSTKQGAALREIYMHTTGRDYLQVINAPNTPCKQYT